MRCLVLALAAFGPVTSAFAADLDMPILRGSNSVVPGPQISANWSGFYVGGQAAESSAKFDFSQTTVSLIQNMLREATLEEQQQVSQWGVLGQTSSQQAGYGGFVGYNTQWDEAIIGLELNYTRSDIAALAPSFPITRTTSTSDGNSYVVNLTGAASMHVTDLLSLRARGGWAVDNFLPYVAFGVVAGRANYTRSATVSGTETTSGGAVTPFSFTQSDQKDNAIVYGWSAALGVDVAILPNAFLRGEVEYTHLFPIASVDVGIASARLGAGLRF